MQIIKILNRVYVNDIEKSIEFYEKVLDLKCGLRFQYSEMNLELAQIGNILIISGSDEALKPFRDTQATFLVDSVTEFKDFLLNNGAKIIRDLKNIPTGINMTVKHLDGTIVEYVEHKSKDYLYHYTSINTLGFILKNRNIRFNNLCALDDIDEGIYSDAKWGKYCFVSSWTAKEDESIEMWKMYSNDMNGVRIKLRKNPFEEYVINEPGILQTNQKTLVDLPEIYNDLYSFASYKKDKILQRVIYRDIDVVDTIKKMKPPFSYKNGAFSYDVSNVGIYKNNYWKFQQEWRYLLHIIPFGIKSIYGTPEDVVKKIKQVSTLPELPFKDYYLKIDKKVYEEMEILLGPKTNESDKEVVELLVKKFNPVAFDKIKISCLSNRIR